MVRVATLALTLNGPVEYTVSEGCMINLTSGKAICPVEPKTVKSSISQP